VYLTRVKYLRAKLSDDSYEPRLTVGGEADLACAANAASTRPAHYGPSPTLLTLRSGFREQPFVPARSIDRIMKLDLFAEILPLKHSSIVPPKMEVCRMNQQERKIINLVLNEMAFEGAIKHFHEAPTNLPRKLFEDLMEIGIPGRYDGSIEDYRYVHIEFDNEKSVFENCYRQLRTIRNNIVHANKAYRPDPPERLNDLLDWAQEFIHNIYETNSPLAERAMEIKATLGIENF